MIPTWILLIVINGGTATSTASFYTQEACKHAIDSVTDMAWSYRGSITPLARCVPSGAPENPKPHAAGTDR